MLKIIFGELPEAIYNTDVYFGNTYEDTWVTASFAKDVIKDIDKSEVLSAYCIQSPILGQITPSQLSGGTKTLLLMYNEPERIFNASTCGDNCAKQILKMGKEMDLTINLRHSMDFGKESFDIEVLNNGETVHCMKELLPIACKYLREGNI